MTDMSFDDTELQMIYYAVQRVKPFADLSHECRDAEQHLEEKLRIAVDALRN